MAQCKATTKQGERCKNSCISGSTYCRVHDGLALQSNSANESYVLNREELLKFVELDLWGRFRTRLFAAVGTALVLATLVGLFGIPYYINTELTSRLQESTKEFDQKTTEIIRHAKLLALVSVAYNRELGRLNRDINSLIESIQRYNNNKAEEKQIKEWTLRAIKRLLDREEYHTIGQSFFPLHVSISEEHGSIKIASSKVITMEIIQPTGAAMTSHGHPIHNGTLRGVVNDIKFRIVSLEAFRTTMNALREDLLELGADKPTQKRMERVEVVSLFEEKFSKSYQEQVDHLAKAALPEEESKQLDQYRYLYLISVPIGEQ